MTNITLETIQQRFPIGDYIEYQTGNGFFSSTIRGYEDSKFGVSLELVDRKCPIWDETGFKRADSYHISAQMKLEKLRFEKSLRIKVPILEQLTLF